MSETMTFEQIQLESGDVLHQVPVAYRTWGRLNDERDNVIVVCHALTGDTNADVWWGPMIGSGRVLDTDRFFVISANVAGSPYGSVSPLTRNPETGKPYGPDFPALTIRDTITLHRKLLDRLGVQQVAMAVGGSLGGMQALEWAFQGDFVRTIVPIGVGGRHSAWCIGWSEVQRQAIYADPRWLKGWYDPADPPASGLSAARMAAMISYRSRGSFELRFGRAEQQDAEGVFAIESYLRYQGDKLVQRFDANCYVQLTKQMDTHDLARGRGSYPDVLEQVRQPALVIGIDSDVLYPVEEQEELASHLPAGRLAILSSPHGHDAFLIEFDKLEDVIRPWMDQYIDVSPPAEKRMCVGCAS